MSRIPNPDLLCVCHHPHSQHRVNGPCTASNCACTCFEANQGTADYRAIHGQGESHGPGHFANPRQD